MKKAGAIAWNTGESAVDNARVVLPELARLFFEAGQKAAAPKATNEAMHRFRLETKRFRYTLELFRPLYGPGLDRQLSALRSVQEVLGDLNDCVTTQDLVLSQSSRQTVAIRDILRGIDQRMAELRQRFRRLWSASFQEAEHQRWAAYLARYAGQPGARKAPARKKPAGREAGPQAQAAATG